MEAMASRPSQHEDLKWVAAALDGRPEAFSELVKRYQDRIFNTIFRMLGDYEEATDLTQQTFLKAYMSLDRFGGRSSFYTWLYRIGVNATLDERKKRSRRPGFTDHVVAVTADRDGRRTSNSTRTNDPAEKALVQERRRRVTNAIAALDDLHRSVIVLRDIEGMDYDEIAEVLGCPRGTVKSRLHRARCVLRDKLKGRI
jgi:RNA polymerase sigma-70 factor (ECF subfamily)